MYKYTTSRIMAQAIHYTAIGLGKNSSGTADATDTERLGVLGLLAGAVSGFVLFGITYWVLFCVVLPRRRARRRLQERRRREQQGREEEERARMGRLWARELTRDDGRGRRDIRL